MKGERREAWHHCRTISTLITGLHTISLSGLHKIVATGFATETDLIFYPGYLIEAKVRVNTNVNNNSAPLRQMTSPQSVLDRVWLYLQIHTYQSNSAVTRTNVNVWKHTNAGEHVHTQNLT